MNHSTSLTSRCRLPVLSDGCENEKKVCGCSVYQANYSTSQFELLWFSEIRFASTGAPKFSIDRTGLSLIQKKSVSVFRGAPWMQKITATLEPPRALLSMCGKSIERRKLYAPRIYVLIHQIQNYTYIYIFISNASERNLFFLTSKLYRYKKSTMHFAKTMRCFQTMMMMMIEVNAMRSFGRELKWSLFLSLSLSTHRWCLLSYSLVCSFVRSFAPSLLLCSNSLRICF